MIGQTEMDFVSKWRSLCMESMDVVYEWHSSEMKMKSVWLLWESLFTGPIWSWFFVRGWEKEIWYYITCQPKQIIMDDGS